MPDPESPRRPATMYDVAKVAGVSHQSVSRYIGGEPVRQATAERVAAAIAQLGYRANVQARSLRTGRTGVISLVIPGLFQPYYAALAQDVIRAARPHGLTVFVETTDGDPDNELDVLTRTANSFVDGIIFAPQTIGLDELTRLGPRIPLVLLGDRVPRSEFDHVAMDNTAGSRLATEHLLDSGRRRIAALGVEPHSDFGAATPRLEGYLSAHRERGIPTDDALLVPAGAWLRESGEEQVRRMIEQHHDFDAILCFNDALALGALRALWTASIRVPEDVAVMGFDNTEDSRFSTPSLSTIDPRRDLIAGEAIRMLRSRMNPSQDSSPSEFVAPAELVPREST